MRRLKELIPWTRKPDVLSLTSEIWVLGTCYKISSEDLTNPNSGHVAFINDFSLEIWMTYRKGVGFSSPGKDHGGDPFIRAAYDGSLLLMQPYDPEFIEILHLFGDSVASSFSVHNLLDAWMTYGLAAGSWIGPYAMCCTWETLARSSNKHNDLPNGKVTFPMAIYIVADNEDGEQGGAPVVCIERATKLCYEFSKGEFTWSPILFLVPLVLGLEKIDPRYVPSLRETFTFPQSLGILGGKPGASTYIVGVQDENALYLDPHEVQLGIDSRRKNLEADTSSYHCNIVRDLPLELIDPSVAIGFYCRDKGDFEDFCSRASKLQERSKGAPLFTVAQSFQSTKTKAYNMEENSTSFESNAHADEWQILL